MFRPTGQKRASAPKVRTGCVTCKSRRVKCDETKPRCNQCTKSRRACQWKKERVSTTSRILVPVVNASRTNPPAALVKTPSHILPFEDAREPAYFRTYLEEVHRELAGAFIVSPWFHSVLRACHTEPSILRAVVAIGALNKSSKIAHFADHGPPAMKAINKQAADTHREYALVTYSKALAGLSRLTLDAQKPVNLRHILIGTLLIHCMEIFLQSPEGAFQQSGAGYALLLDYIAANKESTKQYKWTASPNTAVIEDAIFHEHMRIQNDRALSKFSPPLAYHREARKRGELTVLEMPSSFPNLVEAQDHSELLMHRITHLIAEIRATIREKHILLGHPLAIDLPGFIVDRCDLPHLTHLRKLRDTYMEELQTWQAAFAPLLAQLSLLPDTRSVVGSAIQQNHVLNGIIVLSTILDPTETVFEQVYDKQAEIIALIVRSLKITPHVTADLRPVFQISSTFHDPIANIAASCRDKALREQALHIMIRMSPRDSTVERQRRVFSHKYLVSLEELNRLPDGSLPDELRYRIVETYMHGQEESCTVVVLRRIHSGPRAELYPSTKRYRWKTWTREQTLAFDVGDLVSDLDGEEMVEREREEEIKKWPRGLAKPAWIRWWEVFHDLPKSAAERKLRPVRDLPRQPLEMFDEDAWMDMPETPAASISPQQLVIEQIGGFGGWVPYLDVFPDQDLDAIHRKLYQSRS